MPSHPFYPRDALLPGFQPATRPATTLLAALGVPLAVLVVIGLAAGGPRLTHRLLLAWFLCCGMIHSCIEGYYGYNHVSIASQTSFMADMWKEYAMSDSRYMTNDSFVAVMESMTAALWGPLSFYTAYLIWRNRPERHLLQFLVSTGQIYGDIAYYLTAAHRGFADSSPHPYYFYFYFVFMNSLWILFPALIMRSSGLAIVRALAATNPASTKKKRS